MSTNMTGLPVLETTRILRLTRAGRLQPWLGPALRGLAAARFKARVCRFSPEIQQGERLYCKGCPHIGECPYGRTVEPDPPQGAMVFGGQEDATRPIVIAPDFPVPSYGVPGMELPVQVLFIGRTAAAHADEFWAALAEAGRDPEAGLDPDRTTFQLLTPDPPLPAAQWHQVELPTEPSALLGEADWVRVKMTGPLVLRESSDDGRRLVAEPAFADLLRASLRTLGVLFRLYGTPLSQDAFFPLKQLAAGVQMRSQSFALFRQARWSRRSQQHALLTGVLGEAVYGPVPKVLIPWLTWGGRLRVGSQRVAGAGGWRTWEANGQAP